jgi:O-6-methylguanine DNA methyltransferase
MSGIVYTKFDTPVGRMVTAATARGCCLLEFEDRGGLDRIKSRVLKRHGAEMAEGTSSTVDRVRMEVAEYFAGERRRFSFPLDMIGTPFQKSVWNELLRIPYGEKRTYGEIAAAIGRPKAVRAIGRANGDNYISIAVPCHRVVESGGGLRGYGGGLWRKKRLLDLEAASGAKTAEVGSGPGRENAAKRFTAEGLNACADLFEGQ